LPFEIPDNWTWIRLKNLCKIIFSGKSPKYSKGITNNIAIGQAANNGVFVDLKLAKFCTDDFVKDMPDYYYLKRNDVLLNTLGHGTLGRCGIFNYDREDILTDGHLFVFRLFNEITSILLYKFLYLNRNEIEKSSNGTTNQIFLSLSTVGDYLFPLAPLSEQERIVKKINICEPLLKDYELAESRLTQLEQDFPEKLKKSILQYAIEGKLVKQDPNDEPASILLERIKTEKEKLIKEGKIKRDKNESYIYQGDDKNYYENLPLGWECTTLSKVISLVSGTDLKPEDYSSSNIGIPYITGASNITENNEILINRFTNKKYINSKQNDILLSCKGTVGKIVINNIGDIHIARQFMGIKSFVNREFLIIYLKALISKLVSEAKSIIPGIDRSQILTKEMLLPPENEQLRISNKVNVILAQIIN